MAKRRLGVVLTLALLSLGVAATVFWLTLPRGISSFASSNPKPLLVSIIVLVVLTSLNLATRWVRWRYLLRRLRFNLKAKDSVMVWTVTLPALATPFYLGELVRGGLLSRRYPNSFRPISGVWLIERIVDAVVIGTLVLAAQQRWQILAVVLVLSAISVIALRLTSKSHAIRAITRPSVLSLVVVFSLFAWILPMLGLWAVLQLLQVEVQPVVAVETFGIGTLLGGLTGIPLGIGVAGSTMIVLLQANNVELEVAILAIAIFRAGTVWYALGIGILAFLRYKDYVIQLFGIRQEPDHFDRIAPGYDQNIPQHLVDRLLVRKTEVMRDWLSAAVTQEDWTGLDIGCGQGWYASEMAGHGYSMTACDLSFGQTEQAGRYISQQGELVRLCVADASFLPYESGSFDFAYGVNLMHHLPQDGSLRRVTSEIVRILKPGGLFFLHEINTQNPLFRFYMGYIFPLLRDIDEGTESWVMPKSLPAIEGADWEDEIHYFSFLPDFAPRFAIRWLSGIEKVLEGSPLSGWSSHFVAFLGKHV